MAIPLSRTPAILFNKERWAEFCSHFQTSDIAIARISRYPAGQPGFHCDDDLDLPDSPHERERIIEEVFQLGMGLIGELKDRLIKQEITATGTRLDTRERGPIPVKAWTRLWLEFDTGCAMGPLEGYSDLELEVISRPDLQAAELVDRCTQWLRSRGAEGEMSRKVLEQEAYDKFGPELKTRMFSAAYKEAFNRQRGRPRGYK